MDEFLRLSGVHAHYGESHILHGVDLTVRKGEVVTLLGRNGAGRTTTLKAILGLVGRRTGSILIDGVESVRMAPHEIARRGIGYCPEERGIFASLTCEENLKLPPELVAGGMAIDEIYKLFPNLYERRNSPGTRLSGGEQQMLAVARILRTGARLLLLDEISEGLAPVIVQTLARTVRTTFPPNVSGQSPSAASAFMKASLTNTETLKLRSRLGSRLASMNASMSG